ncbi:MAG TPA: DUF4340 domain-containing protein [Elusimicrobiota bacterium]|nr:DUF4340 domain-containing protein [Elusimicrobiota bacterium]
MLPSWLKRLLGILLLVTAATIAVKIPRPAPKPPLPELPASPEKLEIVRPDARLLFQKSGDEWTLQQPLDYPADAETLKLLFSSLSSLSTDERLTDRAETHSLYEVNDSSAILVRVWGPQGKEPAEWLFGKTAPDFLHIYLRRPGRPEVYLAKGVERDALTQPLARWRERRLFKTDPADGIHRLVFRREKTALELLRASDTWTLAGKTAETSAVENFLASLRVLSVEEFIDPPASSDTKKFGLLTTKNSLEVLFSSGKTVRLDAGEKDAVQNRYPLRRNEEPSLFWISANDWDGLFSGLQRLRPADNRK